MMRFHNFPLRKRESFTPIASPTHSYNPRPYRFSMRLRRDDPASTNAASHRTHHKHKPAPSPRPPQRLGYSSVAGPVATSGRGLEPCIAGESISTSTSPLADEPSLSRSYLPATASGTSTALQAATCFVGRMPDCARASLTGHRHRLRQEL